MIIENKIYRSETKSLKIPSCRIEKDFLKKIYQLIYDSNNEAIKNAVEDIKRENFNNDEDYNNAIELTKSSYKLIVIVSGENGEFFASYDASIFDNPNLPEKIKQVNFSNTMFYKMQLNIDPAYKIELLLDFSKPMIIDILRKPSEATINLSNLNISGPNMTWVRGTYDKIYTLIKDRKSSVGWLHKKNIYDIFIWFGIIPLSFYYLNKFNNQILSQLSNITDVLKVGIFIYIFLFILFLFMFVFNYARWVYPYMELESLRKKGSFAHRLVFYAIFLGIVGSFIYDLLKGIF